MSHWLDDVAVSVADGTPRRSMLRKLGAGLLGAVAVMAAGSRTAAADDRDDKEKKGVCPPGFTECERVCRATSIDPDNCGACGRACAAGQTCRGGQCVSPVCDPTCCPAGFTLQNGVCVPSGSGTTCQSSADCGPCGTCSQGTCVPAPAGTVCRAAAGPCDVAEVCNGVTMQCPPDAFRPASTVCRPSGSPICDPAEFCTGASAQCPSDTKAPDGTPCDNNATCRNGQCFINPCPAGTVQCGTNCCPTGPNQITQCSAFNACLFTCLPGFANCDGNAATGCETNTASNVANCGACGTACTAPANATARCVNGQCGYVCNAGFRDCGGTCVPLAGQCP